MQAIVQIGQTLDIETVAEGVETLEHMRIVRELGCSARQGSALARRMEERDLLTFMREGTWRALAADVA